MKTLFYTIIGLVVTYLGFIQDITFFKVLSFISLGILWSMALMIVAILMCYPHLYDTFKKSINESSKNDFIIKNNYVSYIFSCFILSLNSWMIYQQYQVFASLYFIAGVMISYSLFTIRKEN